MNLLIDDQRSEVKQGVKEEIKSPDYFFQYRVLKAQMFTI
jgi:hypothetical protein